MTEILKPARPWLQHFYQDIQGYFWFETGYRRMLDALPADQPSVFVEVGCFRGKSTAFLGVEVLNRGKPVTIHAVDAWAAADVGTDDRVFAEFSHNLAPVAVLLGERFVVHRELSVEAAAKFDDYSLDVVWLDGAHDYDSVRADILAWFPKVKPGGWLGGDDFNMTPVWRAVLEQFGENYILMHGWTTNPVPQPWPSWFAKKA